MALKTYKVVVNKLNGMKMELDARGHKVIIDEPVAAGGTDEGMTPVEMMLGSLGACQAMTTFIYARMYGIKIDELRVEVVGYKDPDVRPGFQKIHFHYYVSSNMPEVRIRQLLGIAEKNCPVEDTIKNGVVLEDLELTMIN